MDTIVRKHTDILNKYSLDRITIEELVSNLAKFDNSAKLKLLKLAKKNSTHVIHDTLQISMKIVNSYLSAEEEKISILDISNRRRLKKCRSDYLRALNYVYSMSR